MRQRDLSSYGLQRHSEIERHDGRALLFGTILILVHLLRVQPTEISAAGLKIEIEDVAVLRGIVALLFAYFGYRALFVRQEAHHHLPVFHRYSEIRRGILLARRLEPKKRNDPRAMKAAARSQLRLDDILFWPFIIGVFLVVVPAIILACIDIYQFTAYLVRDLQGLLHG